MTPIAFAALALAGGLGAVARFVLDGAVRGRIATAFPVGTVLINLTGSLALGLVAGLATAHAVPDALRAVVGTGFLGGYTTFSTASVETIRLLRIRRPGLAALNAIAVLVAAVLLGTLGLVVGEAL